MRKFLEGNSNVECLAYFYMGPFSRIRVPYVLASLVALNSNFVFSDQQGCCGSRLTFLLCLDDAL